MTVPRAEPEVTLNNILATLRETSATLDQRDTATRARLSNLESAVNDLMKQMGRPHGGFDGFGDIDERRSAIGLLEQRHFNRVTKFDGAITELSFSNEEIAEAMLANKAMKKAVARDLDRHPAARRKKGALRVQLRFERLSAGARNVQPDFELSDRRDRHRRLNEQHQYKRRLD
jgi:hypothetical protein